MSNYIYQYFSNTERAQTAFNTALQLGYKPEDITIIMSEDTKKHSLQSSLNESAPKDLGTGGLLGGAIGGTIGGLIALGTNFALPGLGLIMVGPLVGAGGISGGLLGSLLGWTIPNENNIPSSVDLPNSIDERIENGAVLLIVQEIAENSSLKQLWSTIEENAKGDPND